MALALELVFAAGLAAVAVSFGALALGRARERYLLAVAVVLAVGAVAAVALLAVNLVESFTDSDPLLLAAGGLAAAGVAELGLIALDRGLRRTRDVERVADAARADLLRFVEREMGERMLELERLVARERANTSHQLSEQERRLP